MGVYLETETFSGTVPGTATLGVTTGPKGIILIIQDVNFESIFLTFEQVDSLILELMNIKMEGEE